MLEEHAMKDGGRDFDLLAILVLTLILGILGAPRLRFERWEPHVRTAGWEMPAVRR